MPDFRRGFKTWCEKAAEGVRRDLGLSKHSPLDPRALASHMGIQVWEPDDVPDFGRQHRNQLLINDAQSWSAVTIVAHGKKLIIVNSAHAPTRQNSSITHELAYLILDHAAARVDVSPQGLMLLDTYSKAQEAEADWLSGALLVPREALLALITRDPRLEYAASHFGVSVQLVRMRRDMTSIERQLGHRVVRH